jgi:hypothetical protein
MLNKVFSILLLSTLLTIPSFGAEQTGSSILPKPRALNDMGEMRPHVGILAGTVDQEGSLGSQGTFGLEVGLQLYLPMALVAEISNTKTDALEQTMALLRATYNFGGNNAVGRYSYAGLILGADFERSGTYVASGPIVGFDIPTSDRPSDFISIGANARYVILSKGDPDTLVGLNGVVKYWY